jgi:alpha-tubulin suppressor-like RCC1 family protein
MALAWRRRSRLRRAARHDASFGWSDGPLHEEMCALQRSGEVQCWQESEAPGPGQDGVLPETLRTVPGLTDAVQLVHGTYHVCALRKTGKVVCWGNRDYLGDGGGNELDTPALVKQLQL